LNYYLSIVSFLAAVDTGIIRQESFQIVQRDIFLFTNSDQCLIQAEDAMIQWRIFSTLFF
jgi:hypothetical protein